MEIRISFHSVHLSAVEEEEIKESYKDVQHRYPVTKKLLFVL